MTSICYTRSMQIKNKVAIVTGASSGIGLATAKLLSQNGVKVALIARSKEKLEQLSNSLKDSIAIATDMRDETAITVMVKKTRDHYGQIDILVNNAGQGYHVPIMQIDTQKYKSSLTLM